jgi:hypothetical protein
MANTPTPQKQKIILQRQTKQKNDQKTHGDVRQDGNASRRVRVASSQASRAEKTARSHASGLFFDRSQTRSTKRQTVQAAAWVKKPISNQIDEKARLWKVSRSRAIGRLIERGLIHDIFSDYEAIICGVIREAIAKEIKTQMKWRDSLLIRAVYYIAQIRGLLTNLMHFIFEDKKALADIVSESQDQAQNAVRSVSEPIAAIIREIEIQRHREKHGGGDSV